jgi:hypothetical protein
MNALVVIIICALIVILSLVLYFAHVLSFDGSLLLAIGAYFVGSLMKGVIDARV